MEFNQINQLLEKYFNGETSLAEESQLEHIFSKTEIPPELELYRHLFNDKANMKQEMLPENFSDQVIQKIQSEKVVPRNTFKLRAYLIRIAALFFLAAAAYIMYQQNEETPTYASNSIDTEASPEEAYQEARDALLLVSSKLFKGQKIAQENVAKLKPLDIVLPNN
jgi:hypothetical protein